MKIIDHLFTQKIDVDEDLVTDFYSSVWFSNDSPRDIDNFVIMFLKLLLFT